MSETKSQPSHLSGMVAGLRTAALLAALTAAVSAAAPSAETGVETAFEVTTATATDQIGEVTLFGEEEFTIQAATKTEIPISKAPGSVTVISARQIKESGARTIPELLRSVPGVNVRWNPMVQTVDMRSFGQNPFTSRVLLLIDGVPYNSWNKGGFPQHPGFDFFILQNIKRIEILRGPGSALYGENAFWGVINIVSLSGEDLEGGKVTLSGGDLLDQSLGAVYGKKVGENGSILVSGRVQRGQLPVRFWFEENDSEVKGSDVFVKGRYKNFEASYYRHDDDVDGFDVPGFLPGTRFRGAAKISQTVEILATKFKHDWDAKGVTFSADVSFAKRDGSRCAACHAAPQNPAFEETVDHGHQLIGDFRLGIRKIPNHDMLLGVEARDVDTGDHTDELLSPGATDADVVLSYTKVAAYFQDQISLADDRLTLTVGARFDGSNDLFDDKLSPRAALVWNPTDRLVVRGGWSTAFRFPNFSELYQNSLFLSLERAPGVFTPIQVFVPNPDLQPEEIRTFDFGIEYRISPKLSSKLDLYYSEVKDFIVLTFNGGGPTLMSFENHPDEAELVGGELEFRWRPAERVTGFVNWSFQDVEQKGTLTASDGRLLEPVYSPKNKINLGVYLGPFAGVRGALEVEWRDERFGPSSWNLADRSALGVLEDYVYVNARLSWDAPVRFGNVAKALRFSIYGHNLTDEEVQETFLPIDLTVAGSTYYGTVEIRY